MVGLGFEGEVGVGLNGELDGDMVGLKLFCLGGQDESVYGMVILRVEYQYCGIFQGGIDDKSGVVFFVMDFLGMIIDIYGEQLEG